MVAGGIGALATWSELISAELPPLFDGLKLAAKLLDLVPELGRVFEAELFLANMALPESFITTRSCGDI